MTGGRVGMGGAVGRGHDGWWWGQSMLRLLLAALWRRRLGAGMGRWEVEEEEEEEGGRRSAVLPVAVGHGILSLLLLEELCDGQQLFQHMLHMRKQEFRLMCMRAGWPACAQMRHKLSLTCCAPLSLLSVRSSSECVAQTSCSAARSRDRSVLKCSVASGRSGTF